MLDHLIMSAIGQSGHELATNGVVMPRNMWEHWAVAEGYGARKRRVQSELKNTGHSRAQTVASSRHEL